MQRILHTPRPDWVERLQRLGIKNPIYESDFGTQEEDWHEGAAYSFTREEVEFLRRSTQTLQGLVHEAVEAALQNPQAMRAMGFPVQTQELMRQSWLRGDRHLLTRVDWSYHGGENIKLHEINAEACHGTLMNSRVQQDFMQSVFPDREDWNEIEATLLGAWKHYGIKGPLYMAFSRDNVAHANEILFLADVARKAGLAVRTMYAEDIGLQTFSDDTKSVLVDTDNVEIGNLLLFQDWVTTVDQEFGEVFYSGKPPRTMIEPIWRMLLGSKAFYAFMWDMFEGHPLLLPSYLESDERARSLNGNYARKPIFGWDGANVQLFRNGQMFAENQDSAADSSDGFVLQALHELPEFGGLRPVVSTWIVANHAAGLAIRESGGPITNYWSPWVPHVIND